MKIYLLAFLVAFAVGVLISPIVIKVTKRLKFGQNILSYVDNHKSKQGTPTMGGVIFLLAIVLSFVIFARDNSRLGYVALSVTVAYGLIGFLDDFLKIKHKQNLGLRAYQKVIGQVLIAIILAIFVYKSNLVGTSIAVPFTSVKITLGWWIIPFVILVFLATTNSVNLTDGLDGLAGGVSTVYLVGFFSILQILLLKIADPIIKAEGQNLLLLNSCALGGLFAYLCFNCFPAKIFMGDTGSLALGGLIASLAVLSGTELFIITMGLMFVLSSVSVILQVVYFKITKGKRIFLMAPLHHHFERKGVNENKIVSIYIIITVVLVVINVLLQINFAG